MTYAFCLVIWVTQLVDGDGSLVADLGWAGWGELSVAGDGSLGHGCVECTTVSVEADDRLASLTDFTSSDVLVCGMTGVEAASFDERDGGSGRLSDTMEEDET